MAGDAAPGEPALRIEGLRVEIETSSGRAIVVDDLDLAIPARRTLAVVGESGSGKSMSALAIMRLLPDRVAYARGGRVWLGGRDILALPERRMRAVRGAEVAMIFQEPMTSLNPVLTVGDQITEAIAAHRAELSSRQRRALALELMARVRLPDPARAYDGFPHQLSGGQRQRVMIAIALACEPRVLLADEPTTALDATVQADILDLLKALQAERGLAILLITHNLGVVAAFADRVAVMYAGRKVEEAAASELFRAPLHPYTRALLAAIPAPRGAARAPLAEIGGVMPALSALPPGCAFAPRCPLARPICADRPRLDPVAADHAVACFAATRPLEHAAS